MQTHCLYLYHVHRSRQLILILSTEMLEAFNLKIQEVSSTDTDLEAVVKGVMLLV